MQEAEAVFWLASERCARLFSALAGNERECRSVELRALCNEVPRTPPGPEGSNGIGIASGAADHPKFLALLRSRRRTGGGEERRSEGLISCFWLE